MKKFLFAIAFFFVTAPSYGQGVDIDTSETYLYRPFQLQYLKESDFVLMDYSDTQRLDTSLIGFEAYYPGFKRNFPMIDLGFEYSPFFDLHKNLILDRKFQLGSNNDNQAFMKQDIPVFFAPKPISRLNYSQGPNEMIFVEAKHYNPVSNRLKLGIDYKRLKNQNIYHGNLEGGNVARLSDVFNVHLFTQYLSKERDYELLASFIFNKWNNAVTGEMSNDSIYRTSNVFSRDGNVLGVIGTAVNNSTETGIKTVQIFRLGGEKADSNTLYDLGRFSHQVVWTTKLNRRNIKYIDLNPNGAYYRRGIDFAFFNEIRHTSFENDVRYVAKLKKQLFSAGLTHSVDGVLWDSVHLQTFQNISIHSENRIQLTKDTRIFADGYLNLVGYNAGDWDIHGNIQHKLPFANVNAGIQLQRIKPYYLWHEFRSFPINYTMDFNALQTQRIYGGLHLNQSKKWDLGIETDFNNQLGTIYYEGFDLPKQWNSNVILWSNRVPAALHLKAFHLEGVFIHNATSEAQIIPRPQFSYQATAYTNVPVFKKTLMTQLGATVYGAGAFFAPMYQPFLRTWTVSNEMFNPNTVVNVFLNAYIKGFSFGLHYFNTTHLFWRQDDFASPGYPIIPGSLRLNVRWDLYN